MLTKREGLMPDYEARIILANTQEGAKKLVAVRVIGSADIIMCYEKHGVEAMLAMFEPKSEWKPL
jgi:hypothetical protein